MMGQWVKRVRNGEEESWAYEATSEVYTERTALLAQVDVIEEWEWVYADTARVII
jgi:hypothetical protein